MKNVDIFHLLTEISPGSLNFGEARMVLFDIEEGFWGIRRQVEALIGEKMTNSVFQGAGANGGASFAATFGAAQDTAEQGQLFESCVQALQIAGFGEFEINKAVWPLGHVTIRAQDAFEAWMAQCHDMQVEGPICAYTAGMLVGFVNVVSNRRDVVCIEHKCQANGDEYCEFELLPVSESRGQSVITFTPDPMLGRQINLLQMLFERMPMGIAILDRDYRIQRYNPTWMEFSERYGPPSGTNLAAGIHYFEHLPGTESVVLPLFQRVLAGETVRQNGVRLESEGIVTYWDVVLAPLIENDNVTGILNVAVDATERITLHQNLEQRVEERTQELKRRREIAESLRDIIGMINSNMPLDVFLEKSVMLAAQRIGAAACLLHRFDLEREMIEQVASYGLINVFPTHRIRPFNALKAAGGEAYLQATLKRQSTYTNYPPLPERVDEIKRDPFIPDDIKAERVALRQKFSASLSVPLFIQEKVYGGMVFYYTAPQEFTAEKVQLATTFAEQVAIALENAHLHQQEQERQLELQILLDVAAVANSSLDLEKTLITTLDLLVSLVEASRAGIILIDSVTGKLGKQVLRPEREISSEDFGKMLQACESVIASGKPLYIEPDPEQGRAEPGALLLLQSRSDVLGVLAIIGTVGHTFKQERLNLFKSIADQLSIAIENARLYEKAEQAAATQERNRLARDLHDAVSQTLFSASLIADVLPKLWDKNPKAGKQKLDELRQLTRGALSEMRTLLLELRPASLVDMDLGDLLRHLTNAFTGRTRISAQLVIDGQIDPSPNVKEVFYRVAQEALNNISKHAGAANVSIRLELTEKQVQLTVQDDGTGFNPQNISPESLGLGIMRERVESIGAQVTIHSEIGTGTIIKLLWKDTDK